MLPRATPWFPSTSLACLGDFYAVCLERLAAHRPGTPGYEEEVLGQAIAAAAYAALAAARLARTAPQTALRAARAAAEIAQILSGRAHLPVH